MKNKLKQLLWNKYVLCGLIDMAITAAILAYLWHVMIPMDAQASISVS